MDSMELAGGEMVGALVHISGLKAAPEHNGKHGHLVIFNHETGRWRVQLCGGGELGLKPANFQALSDEKIFDDGRVIVKKIQGRGYGMVAATAFEAGSLIFQEKPLARVNKDTSLTAKRDASAAQLMEKVYEVAARGGFNAQNPEEWPPEVMECLEKVMDIQAEKAFLKASPEAQRKWLLLQDGATRIATGGDSSVKLVATRGIAAGEEVFVSYLETSDGAGSGGMGVQQRRSILRSKYGFTCR